MTNNSSGEELKKETMKQSNKDAQKEGNKEENREVKKETPEMSDYEFIKEQIKDRPINKRKLMRKMLITAGTAVIFGLVACVTFLFLEPVFGKWIKNDNEEIVLQQVTLPEVPEENMERPEIQIESGEMLGIEETPIENMNLTDADGVSQNETVSNNFVVSPESVSIEIELDDYRMIYQKLYALAEEVSKSIVTVTGITADEDWMNTTYLDTNQTIGIIVADNGYEMLILADSGNLMDAESIEVMFCDASVGSAELKMSDEETGLAIYGVTLSQMSAETEEAVEIATFGSSYSNILLGDAIVAVGNPLGSTPSVCYGAITSVNNYISFTDASYQLLTTDIYGSPNASGVIVNVRGQVIGFINQSYNEESMSNLISAYGISSIRPMIEDLSNQEERAYFGVALMEVTAAARNAYDIPEGICVSDVMWNSPALNSGITTGDIISGMNGTPIYDIQDYMTILGNCTPGDLVEVTFSRLNGEEYTEMSMEVELGAW